MEYANSQPKRKRDLTSGSITRNIFYLAGPTVATMFLETAFSIADIFWVGKLGAVSLAAGLGRGLDSVYKLSRRRQ